uniref:MarR family transcriptional regulator n=1 Tax=Mesoaciditoga lauensis TaxID=1495039 RepID=A0A7V3RF63_9BACT
MKYSLNSDEIVDIFIKIVNQYRMIDEFPRYFGKADIFLHMAEIQTILAIGKNENINVTNLAKFRGITKGAISQMINKLVKKGLVIKNISSQTDNEVMIQLTKRGKEVFEEQKRYNEFLNQKVAEILSGIPEEAVNDFMNISSSLEGFFNEIVKINKDSMKDKGKNQD